MLSRCLILITVLFALAALCGAADVSPPADATPVAEETAPADAAEQTGAEAAPPADDAKPAETHKCFVTGEPWEPSPTRVEAVFSERGHLKRAYFLNMGYFVLTLKSMQEQGRPLGLSKLSIVDFSSFGTPGEQMLDVDREHQNVWFVWAEGKFKGTRPPYILAFGNEDAAKEFVKKRGGKVIDYAKAVTKLAQQLNKDEKTDKFGRQLMQ